MPQRPRPRPASPAPQPGARPSPVDQAVDRAMAALQAGRFEEAERLAGGALKSNWGHVRAALALGQALLLQDRAEAAVAPLRQAARRSRDPSVETLLARALADAGQRDAALSVLREAITRRPAHAQAFLELGNRLGDAGRFDEAAEVLEAGLAAQPGAVVLQVALGYLSLNRNDRDRARALFQAAHAAAPGRRDTTVALANVLTMDGGYAQAAGLYRRALAARPDDGLVQINLAKCLLELGQRDEGEALLRAAARAGPAFAGLAANALSATARGRLFLRPSAAARFLGGAA